MYGVESSPSPNPIFSTTDLVILSVSGMIGIGIADIIFLHSLNILGAGILPL